MEKYRWENDNDHISIESVMSTDLNESALIVASSIGFDKLPIALRQQVAQSNEPDCEKLIEVVKKYAQENGYIRINL